MEILDHKVALVTGAIRGIGRGVAIGLAREGANIAITARTMAPADAPGLDGGRRVSARQGHGLRPEGSRCRRGGAVARWVLTERVKLAARKDHPGFNVDESELADADTPELIGAATARLSVDPRLMEKSGHIQLIAELADEYGLLETDGRRPRVDDFTRELRERIDRIEGALDW